MKKGFTLIELLAVILILGIIALIAVPAVSNIVEDAKKGATEQSVNQFINAIDKQIAINQMNSDTTDDINDGTYDIPLDSKYRVKLKGQTPTDGWVKVEDGNVSEYSLVIGNYTVSYDGTNKTITEGNSQPLIIYRYSKDELYIGDKIDLKNRKYTNYLKYDKDLDRAVETNETHDMVGIYSTNINDVLTVSMEPDGDIIETRSNLVYLKHTLDNEGKIIKTETCLVAPWGTFCQTGGEGIEDSNGDWYDPKCREKAKALVDFFERDETGLPDETGIVCYYTGDWASCYYTPEKDSIFYDDDVHDYRISSFYISADVDSPGYAGTYDDFNYSGCGIGVEGGSDCR